MESNFLSYSGRISLGLSHMSRSGDSGLLVQLLTSEAMKTSEIEGEYLDRESVHSSFCRNFGLVSSRRYGAAESGISDLLFDVFGHWSASLSSSTFFSWHEMLCRGRTDLQTIGDWCRGSEAMQVISGSVGKYRVHFEAPPSSIVSTEMDSFIDWFNGESMNLPALTRAGLVHLYFVSIHPFDDGNGRIARALCEKSLCQSLGSSIYICLSNRIMSDRKNYYSALERTNATLEIDSWLEWFSKTVLLSLQDTEALCEHILFKTRMLDRIADDINARQKKVILRMFDEVPEGFQDGLSADNYIRISKTSSATATRDLGELVELGALIRTGDRKSTRYWLNRDEPSILPFTL